MTGHCGKSCPDASCDSHLQQLGADVDEHGHADAQEAVCAAGRVAEERVPQAHGIRERKLLRILAA